MAAVLPMGAGPSMRRMPGTKFLGAPGVLFVLRDDPADPDRVKAQWGSA
ncbi:hypothetical protein GCM10010317_102810 [Streptomyces mirabilis]|jgi:hypothetical protein|nr:hypothetical protein GCM10010317_102810 [Streptomyces mirabilis]